MLRVSDERRPDDERPRLKGWEAALVERLRNLPRHRAPARLRRRIRAAIAALENELDEVDTTREERR